MSRREPWDKAVAIVQAIEKAERRGEVRAYRAIARWMFVTMAGEWLGMHGPGAMKRIYDECRRRATRKAGKA